MSAFLSSIARITTGIHFFFMNSKPSSCNLSLQFFVSSSRSSIFLSFVSGVDSFLEALLSVVARDDSEVCFELFDDSFRCFRELAWKSTFQFPQWDCFHRMLDHPSVLRVVW